MAEQILSGGVEPHHIPLFNYSDPKTVAVEDYTAWFKQHGNSTSGTFTDCDLEKEMQKVIKFVCLLWEVFFFVYADDDKLKF